MRDPFRVSIEEHALAMVITRLRAQNDALAAVLSSSRRALEEARTEATRWRELLELTVAARDANEANVRAASDQGER